MAIEFRDSFGYYDWFSMSSDTGNGGKWTTVPSNAAFFSFTTGRWGSPSRALVLTQASVYCERVLTAQQTRVIQAAWKADSFANTPVICQYYDGTVKHVEFVVTTAGEIQAKRGDGTVLGTTSGLGLTISTWYYLETKVKVDNSTGTVDLWVNNVSKLALTAQDTQNGGSASSDRFRLSAPAGVGDTYFSDLVVLNTSGSAPYNDRLGEVRVECLFPNANGTTTQFATSTGTNHATLLDESAPNSDTDYVQSNVVGQIDLLNLGALNSTSGATILEVTVYGRLKRSDTTARSISLGVKDASSGTPDFGGSVEVLTTAYVYYERVFTQNPVTAAAWTYTEVNALEAGCKVEA